MIASSVLICHYVAHGTACGLTGSGAIALVAILLMLVVIGAAAGKRS